MTVIRRTLFTLVALVSVCAVVLAALLAWPLPTTSQRGLTGDVLLRDVTVVDVESGSLRRRQNLIIRNGEIVWMGPDEVPLQDSLFVVEGAGRYLIPGLWDMHTHTTQHAAQYQHPLFIANGVTGVRDLWGCMSEPDSFFACAQDRRRWNQALDARRGLSPRYVGQSSYQINGGNEVPDGFPEFFKARTPAEARQLADYYAGVDVDILKPYTELSPQAYLALAQRADELGLSLQGHRPIRVPLETALSVGQRSIEHGRLFLLECFTGADGFRGLPNPLAAYSTELMWRLVDEHDTVRCAALMASMAESSTWWTPTLRTLAMGARAGESDFRNDERLKYVPFLFVQLIWTPDADRKVADNAVAEDVHGALYELAQQTVGQAQSAGVRILAGTDAFDTYVYHGFSLHDELASLVGSGLSPLEALKTATINAAVFSGLEEAYGSIAVGKRADMVLLEADPLLDIRNTGKIAGVFFNGAYFDRTALDDLLAFAEQRAGSIRTNVHILWSAITSPLLRAQFAD